MIHRSMESPSVQVGSGPAFIISTEDVPGGTGDTHDEIWRVPIAGGAAVQVTSHADGTYDLEPVVNMAGTYIAFTRETSAPTGPWLYVVKVDGTGELLLDNTGSSRAPVWLDDTTIVYRKTDGFGGTHLMRIDRDGTNGATIINKNGIVYWHTNGTKIAYIAAPAGSINLYIVNADGSSDTTLDTSVLNSACVYYADGSGNILYGKGTNVVKIKDDGTGGATIVAFPTGFMGWRGMHSDRIYYTHTATGPTRWKLGQIMLSGGATSDVSPDLWVSIAVQRGVPIVRDGRVYTVTDGSRMPEGVDSFVSVAADGSDYSVHYQADESMTPYFQNLIIKTSNN